MINLLECLPIANHATSLYRGRLPLLRLQKKYSDKLMIYPYHNGPVSWDYILLFDIVFLQRPVNAHQFNVMAAAKTHGLPVWIDYDDLLCDIPSDNPAHDGIDQESIKMIGEFIKYADVVTVSTHALKKYLVIKYGHSTKIKVVPNAIDMQMFYMKPIFKKSKNILWRGTHTHMNDLLEYSEEIIEVMNKNKTWDINFMGYNPFFITNKIKNYTYTKKLDLDNYLNLLPRLNNSICIIPLAEHAFNFSKSNIAWIESTYAGAVCLAPDWEEWQRPGIINYSDKADFKRKLNAMIAGKYDLKRLHSQSWHYISKHLSLDKVNKLRSDIIMR